MTSSEVSARSMALTFRAAYGPDGEPLRRGRRLPAASSPRQQTPPPSDVKDVPHVIERVAYRNTEYGVVPGISTPSTVAESVTTERSSYASSGKFDDDFTHRVVQDDGLTDTIGINLIGNGDTSLEVVCESVDQHECSEEADHHVESKKSSLLASREELHVPRSRAVSFSNQVRVQITRDSTPNSSDQGSLPRDITTVLNSGYCETDVSDESHGDEDELLQQQPTVGVSFPDNKSALASKQSIEFEDEALRENTGEPDDDSAPEDYKDDYVEKRKRVSFPERSSYITNCSQAPDGASQGDRRSLEANKWWENTAVVAGFTSAAAEAPEPEAQDNGEQEGQTSLNYYSDDEGLDEGSESGAFDSSTQEVKQKKASRSSEADTIGRQSGVSQNSRHSTTSEATLVGSSRHSGVSADMLDGDENPYSNNKTLTTALIPADAPTSSSENVSASSITKDMPYNSRVAQLMSESDYATPLTLPSVADSGSYREPYAGSVADTLDGVSEDRGGSLRGPPDPKGYDSLTSEDSRAAAGADGGGNDDDTLPLQRNLDDQYLGRETAVAVDDVTDVGVTNQRDFRRETSPDEAIDSSVTSDRATETTADTESGLEQTDETGYTSDGSSMASLPPHAPEIQQSRDDESRSSSRPSSVFISPKEKQWSNFTMTQQSSLPRALEQAARAGRLDGKSRRSPAGSGRSSLRSSMKAVDIILDSPSEETLTRTARVPPPPQMTSRVPEDKTQVQQEAKAAEKTGATAVHIPIFSSENMLRLSRGVPSFATPDKTASLPSSTSTTGTPPGGVSSKVNLIIGTEIRSFIDLREAGPGKLRCWAYGPHKRGYCELQDRGDGTFVLYVRPQETGRHVMNVTFNDEHIPGSPFNLYIMANPRPASVRVYGPGLLSGTWKLFRSNFTIEVDEAGAGRLSVSVRGPQGSYPLEMVRDSYRPRTIHCHYKPSEPGNYEINIKFGGSHVPGSPYDVTITETLGTLDEYAVGAKEQATEGATRFADLPMTF